MNPKTPPLPLGAKSPEPLWSDPEREFLDRQPGRRKRRRAAEGLLLTFGVILGFVVIEGVTRAHLRLLPAKQGYSPVRGRRSREPRNSAGYRDIEHPSQKPPGTRRALFVGDSFTYGAGIEFDDTYAKRTERGLSTARSERWESIVLAVPGIDTEQEEAILENEGFAYSPDLVVLGYVLTDAEDPGAAEQRRARDWSEAEAEKKSLPFWRRSALLSLVADRLYATRENRARIENHLALYRDGAPGFAAVRKSIDVMAAQCRQRNIPFVVVLFPLFANPLDDRYPFAAVHQKVATVARSAGATVVDLLPYYRGMDWHLLVVEGALDEHPNELAHRIAAQALLAALEAVRLPAAPNGGEGGSRVH